MGETRVPHAQSREFGGPWSRVGVYVLGRYGWHGLSKFIACHLVPFRLPGIPDEPLYVDLVIRSRQGVRSEREVRGASCQCIRCLVLLHYHMGRYPTEYNYTLAIIIYIYNYTIYNFALAIIMSWMCCTIGFLV